MQIDQPNWVRLQKALSIEEEHGFINLMGKEKRFSEFFNEILSQPPTMLLPDDLRRWQDMATQFAAYPQLTGEERASLIEDAHQFLLQMERSCDRAIAQKDEKTRSVLDRKKSKEPPTAPDTAANNGNSQPLNSAIQPSRTPPLGSESNDSTVTLDQPLIRLPGIGPRNGERLAKLGLYTVKDLLYYYPRDHIDYARQVSIRELEPGETVTIVGTVKRCNCFTSPRNKKLSILEIVLTDKTGQLKITRFFAGRASNRGWLEQQKRLYPIGATIAASGLVKQNKYGITLDDPQLEVLDQIGGLMESMTVGRVVPIYPLTESFGTFQKMIVY